MKSRFITIWCLGLVVFDVVCVVNIREMVERRGPGNPLHVSWPFLAFIAVLCLGFVAIAASSIRAKQGRDLGVGILSLVVSVVQALLVAWMSTQVRWV